MSISASLRETFNSGATRILNAAAITKTLTEKKAGNGVPKLLFMSRGLNRVVFIKRPKTKKLDPLADQDDRPRRRNGQDRDEDKAKQRDDKRIVTMIYSPFDMDDIPGGGVTFEIGAGNQDTMLREVVGVDVSSTSERATHDKQLLGLLDGLPSLDPFLLKDLVLGEGMEADAGYFDISDDEFGQIKAYILGKFQPITEKVLGSKTDRARELSEQFIMKLWEGRDLTYLAPITQVFHLDPDHAKDIYYGWKGLTYYEFHYKKALPTLMRFADWVQSNSMPSHYIKPEEAVEFRRMGQQVLMKFARHLEESSSILRNYNDAYEELFVREGDARPFVGILQDSSRLFWRTSAAISALDHAVSVWKTKTVDRKRDKLIADELRPLLQTLEQVID